MHIIIPAEYMYPVASLNNGSLVLYIHQFSPENIQLFEWNTITNHTEQILWSLFNPAGLQLLPDNAGFSFIDNGRLRIKLFQKRSPKTIDFDEPIFNINTVQWIDEHTCYCSAQHNNYFSLFQLRDDGTMHCLILGDNKDCMYPQKVDTQLFYIERCKENNLYRVIQTNYPNNGNEASLTTLIVDFEDTPIAFLHMCSQVEGFVLEYSKNIDSDCKTSLFFYHHLIKTSNNWEKKLLFSFEIPTYLFLQNSEQRLFESILPLLPRVIDNKIYFVDASETDTNNLELYYYDLLTMQNNKIIIPNKQGHCFVPMACGDKLCYGGVKQEKEASICFLT